MAPRRPLDIITSTSTKLRNQAAWAVAKAKDPFNPFYPLSMLVGVAFAITCCAFGWMMYLDLRHDRVLEPAAAPNDLITFLKRDGDWLLGIELVALTLVTAAAFAWDRFWSQRRVRLEQQDSPEAARHGS